MTTIKEFIKENSPNAPKKKKRRVRLKNFNPFRKRNYKKLNEDQAESDRRNSGKHSPDDSRNKSSTGLSDDSTKRRCSSDDNRSEKRRGPARNLLNAARGGFGLRTKGNPDDPGTESRRKRARRHVEDSTECLLDQETLVTGAPAEDVSTTNHAPPESSSVRGSSEELNSGSGGRPKQVFLSDEIEVIATETNCEEMAPTVKKKKSKKKRLKKAGIKTARMLGTGLSSMAISFQYMSPEAAVAPMAKELAKRREDRYMELATMAYIMAS